MNGIRLISISAILVFFGSLDFARPQDQGAPPVDPDCPNVTGAAPEATFSAIATWFEPQYGACEELPTGPGSNLVAAINGDRWDNPERSCQSVWCGKCVYVNATDYNEGVTVMVVDQAAGPNFLLSSAAWSFLLGDQIKAASEAGEINVSYRVVDCPTIFRGKSRGKR